MIDTFQNTWGHDTEIYPNVFIAEFTHMVTDQRFIFELSDRYNHSEALRQFFVWCMQNGQEWLGFNNEGFDYPVLHHLWQSLKFNEPVYASTAYEKSSAIIATDWNDRFSHVIWSNERIVPQVDLYKIMHFDNMARATSLKMIEINQRAHNVIDLPYKPGLPLTIEQIPTLIKYQSHDVAQTIQFAKQVDVKEAIAFRRTLVDTMGPAVINYNDTKIGKQFFINELEAVGVQCFHKVDGRRRPRQTVRTEGVVVSDFMIDVPFQTPDLNRIKEFFRGSVIPPSETKGFFKNLSGDMDGFKLDFGSGGLHASVHNKTFRATDTHDIVDIDVVSYYPSLAIANRWYPAHLGEIFCDIYADLKTRRVSYAKGTPENKMLKLALNGVYGDTNSKYSALFDPAYTMAITINGQLLMAWLAESIHMIPGVEMIQINTDGLTVKIPKEQRDLLKQTQTWWEGCTKLDLEEVEYSAMFVRDVNNYIAVDKKGNVKRKNEYLAETALENPKTQEVQWHKDHSSMVIGKAVSAFVVDGKDPVEFIYNHTDPFDFMRRVKVPRTGQLLCGDDPQQLVSRYFISHNGQRLLKVLAPMPGSDKQRPGAIDKGWLVTMCNDASLFDWSQLNRRYYIQAAQKLIKELGLSLDGAV